MKLLKPKFLPLFIALFTALRFLFPSDIPFINDEALLIKKALEENAKGGYTAVGLMGSRGVEYGPFAIWFYRLALLFTHDLVLVALFKMVFIYLVTVASVFSIFKKLARDWKLPVLLTLLSPYLWFYSRDLWDNCFVIPLSVAFYASYLDFLNSRRLLSLLATGFFLSLGFLTHLVFMPLLAAFVVHFLFYEREYVKRNFGKALLVGVLCLALVAPYLSHVLQQRPTQHLEAGDLGHLLMPFTGARFFTALGLEYFLGKGWVSPFQGEILNGFWLVLLSLSALAYPLVVVGLFFMGKEKHSFFKLVLLSFLFQILMSFTYRLIPIPNFHSAQWFVYLTAIVLVLEKLKNIQWGRWVVAPYTLSLSLAIPAFLFLVHYHGGSRVIHYGPTLGNQKLVANQLAKLEAKTLSREVFHATQFPFALDLLTLLETEDVPKAKVGTARIRYLKPSDPRDGRIDLIVTE